MTITPSDDVTTDNILTMMNRRVDWWMYAPGKYLNLREVVHIDELKSPVKSQP